MSKKYECKIKIESPKRHKNYQARVIWSSPHIPLHSDFFFMDSWYRILPFWNENNNTTFIKVHTLKKGITTIYMCDKSKISKCMKFWLWFNKKKIESSLPLTFKTTIKVG